MQSINKITGDLLLSISRLSFLGNLEFAIFSRILKAKIKPIQQKSPRLFWGPIPILNNKYWSKALSGKFVSKTVMQTYYSSINNKDDFDEYEEDILKSFKAPAFIVQRYKEYFLTYYILKNFDIFHLPFSGGFLGETRHWNKEAALFKKYGKRTVLIPYGADAYMYSRIKNESFQNALLISYPEAARNEDKIAAKVTYWCQNADFIPAGFMIDGFPRWDAVVGNFITIDDAILSAKKNYTLTDGENGIVTVVHCPNHRGAKGTEFLIHAINELKAEGLKVELTLIENKKNNEVLRIMNTEADILVEQLIMGYGLNAIEGMASGLPTLSNLSNECYTRLFRRYGTMNECPIVTADPENIKSVLKQLIRNPPLRKELGEASKNFVKKYHSEEFARFLFNKIYDKIWYNNKDMDLMNMFHPLNPDSYNNQSPKIEHPLFENKIPEALLNTLNK